jgi:hypothetical protein
MWRVWISSLEIVPRSALPSLSRISWMDEHRIPGLIDPERGLDPSPDMTEMASDTLEEE